MYSQTAMLIACGDEIVIRSLVIHADTGIRDQMLKMLTPGMGVTVLADCEYGEDALAKIESTRPDAVFAIAGPRGISELAALVTHGYPKRPYLVVIADCDRYAIDAFAINATDYLLTPFDRARLKVTVARLRRNIEMDQQTERRLDMDTLVQRLREYAGKAPAEGLDDRVSINFGGRFRFLYMKSIRYIEADADHVDIHMVTGEVLHATSRISEISGKLPPDRFLRIRRSTIVNISRVREARARKDNYEIVMDNDATFRPGTTYKFKVRAALMKGVATMNGKSGGLLENA